MWVTLDRDSLCWDLLWTQKLLVLCNLCSLKEKVFACVVSAAGRDCKGEVINSTGHAACVYMVKKDIKLGVKSDGLKAFVSLVLKFMSKWGFQSWESYSQFSSATLCSRGKAFCNFLELRLSHT